LAIRCVYDIYRAVDLPIVGVGGVSKGRDAVEMIMAGATAVGIGSAIYHDGPQALDRIRTEMTALMAELGFDCVDDMRGVAHQ
jgi:dihydroorotate dehydrogenase (NAD+) catalytic subunit